MVTLPLLSADLAVLAARVVDLGVSGFPVRPGPLPSWWSCRLEIVVSALPQCTAFMRTQGGVIGVEGFWAPWPELLGDGAAGGCIDGPG